MRTKPKELDGGYIERAVNIYSGQRDGGEGLGFWWDIVISLGIRFLRDENRKR